MEALYTYLVKLSISLSLVYLFYVVFLRRLTFYKWNRYYFILATLLACLLPMIDIGKIQQSDFGNTGWVTMIPTVETEVVTTAANLPDAGTPAVENQWDLTRYFLYFILLGVVVMLVRLGFQMFSFLKLKKSAVLINNEGARLYQVEQPIIPFSFAGSIFINRRRHDDKELKEIIRHEYVHVEEKHSIDILWSEILCVINWYNPFVWLIRRDIRQNLEFIADEKVLSSGLDKKDYQYLLLKVTGIAGIGVGNNFNLSSLRKRIAMMNKNKSASFQLARFLVILPVLVFTLLSFRTTKKLLPDEPVIISYAGIVSDEMEKPMAGVTLKDSISGVSAVTDNRGYFKLSIPVEGDTVRFYVSIKVPGHPVPVISQTSFTETPVKSQGLVHLFKLRRSDQAPSGFLLHDHGISNNSNDVSYERVSGHVRNNQRAENVRKQLDELRGSSLKPLWIMNDKPYAVIENGWAWFNKDEAVTAKDFMVVINDSLLMTMNKANEKYQITDFSGVGNANAQQAIKMFGLNKNLLRFFTKDQVDYHRGTENFPRKLVEIK